MSKEQSHDDTTGTGIIKSDLAEGPFSASQTFGEEKTSNIAFLSDGNEHSHEAKDISRSVTHTLLRKPKVLMEQHLEQACNLKVERVMN